VNLFDPKAPEKFWANVIPEPNSGCWLWVGSYRGADYGQFAMAGKRQKGAHIYSFEFFVGEVPIGLELDHKCRVTVCVNPDHLEAVTHAENLKRARRSHCGKGHSLTGENLYVWIDPVTGWERRYCIACQNARRS